jgi:hypothetical protein
MTACPQCESIDRYFDGKLAPAAATELHRHLPSCASCGARYRRQMLLEKLDPSALSPRERIARGLGIEARGRLVALPVAASALVAAAAAVMLLVVRAPPRSTDGGYAARGGLGDSSHGRVLVYEVSGRGAQPALAGPSIGSGDELAFAFENPDDKKYLMVFAVDDHDRVYWYYPSWTSADEDPASIAIEPGAARRELHEAVRQPLQSGRLVVHALFTDVPLHVRQVESALSARSWPPGAVDQSTPFEVAP